MLALAVLCFGNLGFSIWAHRSQKKTIQDTRDALTVLITGRNRADGPVAAVQTALRSQRGVPAPRTAALNL